MAATRTRIADVIASKTLTSGFDNKYATEIAAYLLEEDRTDELDSLLRDIQSVWTDKGYVEIIARSARPLDNKTKEEIKARIKPIFPRASEVKVTEIIDANVIGGVRITIADKRLDLTIETKLNKFKQLTATGKEL